MSQVRHRNTSDKKTGNKKVDGIKTSILFFKCKGERKETLSRERIKGYSWLCVIFNNLGIDCYSNIFIAILNETLIRFFGLAKRNARGQ